MATKTYTVSASGKTVGSGSTYTFTCNNSFTVPTGCVFKSVSVTKNSQSSGQVYLRNASSSTTTNLSWGNEYTDPAFIAWTDGGTPKVKVYNGASTGQSVSVTVKFTVTLEKVKSPDVIKYTDRSKTGTSTTQYAVMKDSHFSSGTKIEASTFNTAYGL